MPLRPAASPYAISREVAPGSHSRSGSHSAPSSATRELVERLSRLENALSQQRAEFVEHRDEVEQTLGKLLVAASAGDHTFGSSASFQDFAPPGDLQFVGTAVTDENAAANAEVTERIGALEGKVARASELACDVCDQQLEFQGRAEERLQELSQDLGSLRAFAEDQLRQLSGALVGLDEQVEACRSRMSSRATCEPPLCSSPCGDAAAGGASPCEGFGFEAAGRREAEHKFFGGSVAVDACCSSPPAAMEPVAKQGVIKQASPLCQAGFGFGQPLESVPEEESGCSEPSGVVQLLRSWQGAVLEEAAEQVASRVDEACSQMHDELRSSLADARAALSEDLQSRLSQSHDLSFGLAAAPSVSTTATSTTLLAAEQACTLEALCNQAEAALQQLEQERSAAMERACEAEQGLSADDVNALVEDKIRRLQITLEEHKGLDDVMAIVDSKIHSLQAALQQKHSKGLSADDVNALVEDKIRRLQITLEEQKGLDDKVIAIVDNKVHTLQVALEEHSKAGLDDMVAIVDNKVHSLQAALEEHSKAPAADDVNMLVDQKVQSLRLALDQRSKELSDGLEQRQHEVLSEALADISSALEDAREQQTGVVRRVAEEVAAACAAGAAAQEAATQQSCQHLEERAQQIFAELQATAEAAGAAHSQLSQCEQLQQGAAVECLAEFDALRAVLDDQAREQTELRAAAAALEQEIIADRDGAGALRLEVSRRLDESEKQVKDIVGTAAAAQRHAGETSHHVAMLGQEVHAALARLTDASLEHASEVGACQRLADLAENAANQAVRDVAHIGSATEATVSQLRIRLMEQAGQLATLREQELGDKTTSGAGLAVAGVGKADTDSPTSGQETPRAQQQAEMRQALRQAAEQLQLVTTEVCAEQAEVQASHAALASEVGELARQTAERVHRCEEACGKQEAALERGLQKVQAACNEDAACRSMLRDAENSPQTLMQAADSPASSSALASRRQRWGGSRAQLDACSTSSISSQDTATMAARQREEWRADVAEALSEARAEARDLHVAALTHAGGAVDSAREFADELREEMRSWASELLRRVDAGPAPAPLADSPGLSTVTAANVQLRASSRPTSAPPSRCGGDAAKTRQAAVGWEPVADAVQGYSPRRPAIPVQVESSTPTPPASARGTSVATPSESPLYQLLMLRGTKQPQNLPQPPPLPLACASSCSPPTSARQAADGRQGGQQPPAASLRQQLEPYQQQPQQQPQQQRCFSAGRLPSDGVPGRAATVAVPSAAFTPRVRRSSAPGVNTVRASTAAALGARLGAAGCVARPVNGAVLGGAPGTAVLTTCRPQLEARPL
eukprot:TRINITY_DN2724_c0_g1_i1.p1 TRINITY_DN2724_c0_g1~~TRINITY_DN2724_c0_g1_i1.p1  ORF type:complete len:1322 (+),score=378.79 TRINITY_DN2724_c0_g1_i1:81-4046(+)